MNNTTQAVTDAQADEIANACYNELRKTGFNGGMGGLRWDRALVRMAALRTPTPAPEANPENSGSGATCGGSEAPKFKLPPMDDHMADILGMMCFQCIDLARMLRASGQVIATKAEAEQAAVLYWLLGFYFEHGADWRKAASEAVGKYRDAAILSSAPPDSTGEVKT